MSDYPIYRYSSPFIFSKIVVDSKDIYSLTEAIETAQKQQKKYSFTEKGLILLPEKEFLWPVKQDDTDSINLREKIERNDVIYTVDGNEITIRDAIRNTLDATLLWALQNKIKDLIEITIALGADPTISNEKGENSLFYSIIIEDMPLFEKLIQLFIEKKISLDIQDKFGNTALLHAVLKENIYAATQLLFAGADPTIKNNKGYKAAMYTKDFSLIELLEKPDLLKYSEFSLRAISSKLQEKDAKIHANLCLKFYTNSLEIILEHMDKIGFLKEPSETGKLEELGQLLFAFSNLLSARGDMDKLAHDARSASAKQGHPIAKRIIENFSHYPKTFYNKKDHAITLEEEKQKASDSLEEKVISDNFFKKN